MSYFDFLVYRVIVNKFGFVILADYSLKLNIRDHIINPAHDALLCVLKKDLKVYSRLRG